MDCKTNSGGLEIANEIVKFFNKFVKKMLGKTRNFSNDQIFNPPQTLITCPVM
jgi:hypothetical protein